MSATFTRFGEPPRKRIGKYEIQGELGRGGFGQVFLGYDPAVNRHVAIKILSADGDANSVLRFRTEAAAAGSLRHKNIVTIYEFGEDQGTFFIVMEYLDGQDLGRYKGSKNTLSILDKVRIMTEVAEGLQCAHQNGIVHRDVKPANIMILKDGSVKVMDFGIARFARESTARLTASGFLVGSVFYMSPEQLQGHEADGRADIWAYGVIFHELLTGRHPFEAHDSASAMFQITSAEPPSVVAGCPECPAALGSVVSRLLQKSRDLRYQSFEDVLFDMAPIAFELESSQANHLVDEAAALLKQGDLDGAAPLIKRALAFDPAHTRGRALRQQLQNAIQERAARNRFKALLEQGDRLAEAKNYKGAIESFETALALDPSDPLLRERVVDIRQAQERADLAARLLASAVQNLQQNNFSVAFRHLNDALSAEPDNADAQHLFNDVRKRIAQRESERRIADALTKANGLLELQSFDDAIEILEKLSNESPDIERVNAALTSARKRREDDRRERTVQKEMDAARVEIRAGHLDAAIARLDELSKDALAKSIAGNLLAYARNEQASAKRKANIEEALADAEALRKALKFEGAIARLDSALLLFPDDPGLTQFRQILARELEQQRRDAFVQTAIDDAARLDREERSKEACAILERALLRHPKEARLSETLAAIREGISQREEAKRRAALDRDLAQAQGWITEGQIDAAAKLIQQLAERAPNDPRVSALLVRVQSDSERRKAIEAACSEAKRFLDKGQVEAAAGIVAKAKEKHGDTRQFASIDVAVAKALSRNQLLEEARGAIEKSDLRAASAVLQELLRLTGEDAEAQTLHIQVKQGLEGQERQRRLVEERSKAQNLIECQRFEEAARRLRALQPEFPGDPGLAEEMKRALRGLEKKAKDEAAARQAEEARKQTQSALREGRERAGAMRRAGDVNGACRLLQDLCRQYPDQSELVRDRDEALKKIEIDFVSQALSRITDLQRAQNWDGAFAEAEISLAAYPDNAALLEVAIEERKRKATATAAQQIRAAIAALDWESAGKRLKEAVHAFPGEKVFDHLQEELDRAHVGETLRQLAADVESCLQGSNWNGAAAALERNAELKHEAAWKALKEKLELHRKYTKTLGDAEELAARGSYARAEALLKEIMASAPDTRAAGLLRNISVERLRKDREDAVARTRRQVDELLEKAKFQEALGLLDRACKESPADLSLAGLRSQIEARFEEQRREEERSEAERTQAANRARKLAHFRTSVELAAAAGDWQNAFSILDRAYQEFPADPSLQQLRNELAERKTRHVLEELKTAVQQKFDKRDLAGAARLLAANQADFLNEPEWRELEEELLRRRQYEGLVGEAENFIIHANYDAAKDKLCHAIAVGPGLGRANALLNEIEDNQRVRRPFRLKVSLIRRKQRKLIRRIGIGASLLAAMGLAAFVWRLVQPAQSVIPSPTPPQLNFAYREGAPDLPEGKLNFPSTHIDFQVSTEDDWLEVQPRSGSQLNHLQVRVTRAPNPGKYTTALVIHPVGRTLANAILVHVHLEVTGADQPSKPVRLKLDSDRVPFDYTLGQPTPAAKEITVLEGDVRDASASIDWVQLTHRTKSVRISLSPKSLASMAPGPRDAVVTVEPADPRGEPALIQVHLVVRPQQSAFGSGRPDGIKQPEPRKLPDPTPPPPGPAPEPIKSPEKGKPDEATKALPPPPPGCDTGRYGGDKGNTFLWEGNLESGQTVEIRHYWASTGKVGLGTPPDHRVLKILKVDQTGIVVDRVPAIENECNYLRLRNSTSSAVHSLKVLWQWDEEAK